MKKLFENVRKDSIAKKFLNYGFSLNEAVNIAKKFEDILLDYGYKIPEESKIKSIDLTDKEGTFLVGKADNKGNIKQTELTKIGRILQDLFPGIVVDGSDKTVTNMINDLKALSTKDESPYKIIVSDDLTHWYKELHDYGIESCVTWKGRKESGLTDCILSGLDAQEDIKIVIVIRKSDNAPLARAMLWYNVEGIDGKAYLDRIYSKNDQEISQLLRKWAGEQGFDIYDDVIQNEDVSYNFKKSSKEVRVMPYMDTFRYGSDMEKENSFTVSNRRSGNALNDYSVFGAFQIQTGTYFVDESDMLSEFGVDQNVCNNCGEVVSDDDSHYQDDELWCDDCFYDAYSYCEGCDEYYDNDETTYVDSVGCSYCDSCFSEYFISCYKCGSTVNRDDGMYSDYHGESYCTDCFNEEHYFCEECENDVAYDDQDAKEDPNGTTICSDCFDEKYFTCSDCEQPCPKEDMSSLDGMCQDCWELKYFECESCETVYEKDFENEDEEGNLLCNDCYEEYENKKEKGK